MAPPVVFGSNPALRAPASPRLGGLAGLLLAWATWGAGPAAAQAPGWSVDPSAYASTMTVTAEVEAGEAGDRLAAFVGASVRGVADYSGGRFFLTVYANTDGEAVTFRLYDASEDAVSDLAETLLFGANDQVGTPTQPFALTRLDPFADCATGAPAWSVDPSAYPATMTVTGAVAFDGRPPGADDLVAAFAGGEVRGLAQATEVEAGVWRFFLTIYGETDGESLTFRAYERARDRRWTLTADPALVFQTNDVVGTPSQPLVWSADCSLTGTAAERRPLRPAAFTLEVFPHPVRSQATVRVHGLRGGVRGLRLYDLQGRLVWDAGRPGAWGAAELDTEIDTEGLAPGLYLLRAEDEQGQRALRAVVVSH